MEGGEKRKEWGEEEKEGRGGGEGGQEQDQMRDQIWREDYIGQISARYQYLYKGSTMESLMHHYRTEPNETSDEQSPNIGDLSPNIPRTFATE